MLKVFGLLLGFERLLLLLERGQLFAEGAGLLLAQVAWCIFLALECITGGGDALLGKDRQDTGDSFSDGLHNQHKHHKPHKLLLTRILLSFTWGWDDTLLTRS